MASLRKTLVRNTTYNAAGRCWEALSGLVLIRYILWHIDPAGYGLWALVSVFTGYVALLDLGIGSAYVKYIAEYAAHERHDKISSVVTTGLLFYAVLGVLIVAVGWPCIDYLIRLVDYVRGLFGEAGMEGRLAGDVRFLLRWSLVLFAASNCFSAFSSVQTGLQRMGITNMLGFVMSLVRIGATVCFLEMGFGIRGLLYTNAITLGVFGLASVAIAYRLVPELKIGPGSLHKDIFSRLFHFGWRAQVSRFANLIMFQTDKVVVAAVYGLGMVTLYELGLNLANKMRQLPTLLVSAIIPAASHLDALEEHEQLRRLYLLSSKYVAAVAVPAAFFAVAAAGLLLRTWLGPKAGLDTSAWVLRIIALGYVANIVPGAGMSIVLGKGRADIFMRAGVIATAANIALTILLVWQLGFVGIPIATALSMFISWMWFARAMKDVVGVGAREMLADAVWWPCLACLPGFALCLFLDLFRDALAGPVLARFPADGMLSAGLADFAVHLVFLTVAGVLFSGIYLCVIRYTPFLVPFDVEFLGETLRLKHVPGFRRWVRRWSDA